MGEVHVCWWYVRSDRSELFYALLLGLILLLLSADLVFQHRDLIRKSSDLTLAGLLHLILRDQAAML